MIYVQVQNPDSNLSHITYSSTIVWNIWINPHRKHISADIIEFTMLTCKQVRFIAPHPKKSWRETLVDWIHLCVSVDIERSKRVCHSQLGMKVLGNNLEQSTQRFKLFWSYYQEEELSEAHLIPSCCPSFIWHANIERGVYIFQTSRLKLCMYITYIVWSRVAWLLWQLWQEMYAKQGDAWGYGLLC